jgi:hypothetical protein
MDNNKKKTLTSGTELVAFYNRVNLNLLKTKTFGSGAMVLYYEAKGKKETMRAI